MTPSEQALCRQWEGKTPLLVSGHDNLHINDQGTDRTQATVCQWC